MWRVLSYDDQNWKLWWSSLPWYTNTKEKETKPSSLFGWFCCQEPTRSNKTLNLHFTYLFTFSSFLSLLFTIYFIIVHCNHLYVVIVKYLNEMIFYACNPIVNEHKLIFADLLFIIKRYSISMHRSSISYVETQALSFALWLKANDA